MCNFVEFVLYIPWSEWICTVAHNTGSPLACCVVLHFRVGRVQTPNDNNETDVNPYFHITHTRRTNSH